MSTGSRVPSATAEDVQRSLAQAEEQLAKVRRLLDAGRCYCEENSYEHRGACNHHENLARWKRVTKIGRDLLSADLATFHAEAPDFVNGVAYAMRYT
jgi:hypothetical protein